MPTRYRTTMSSAALAESVSALLAARDFAVIQDLQRTPCVVKGRTQLRWWRLLLAPRPHCLEVVMEIVPDGVRFFARERFPPWYKRVLACCLLASLGLWAYVCIFILASSDKPDVTVELPIALISLSLIGFTFRLLSTSLSRVTSGVDAELRELHRMRGERMSIEGRPALTSPGVWVTAVFLVVFVLMGALSVVGSSATTTISWGDLALLVMSMSLCAGLVGLLAILFATPGSRVRTSQLLPSFVIVLALMEFAAGTVLVLTSPLEPSDGTSRSPFLLPFACAIFTALGIGTFLFGLCCSRWASRQASAIQRSVDDTFVSIAVSGGSGLGAVRGCTLVAFVVASLGVWASAVIAVVAGIEAMAGKPTMSGAAALLASYRRIVGDGAPWLAAFLAGLSLIALGIPTILLGGALILQYVRETIRLRRDTRVADSVEQVSPALRALISRVAARGKMLEPRVVVAREGSNALCVASAWPDAALVIDPSLLTSLGEAPLESLIAHELAHIRCGHLRRHEGLRLIGRVLLIGDACVVAMEHSVALEDAADRCAHVEFGVETGALIAALRTYTALLAVNAGAGISAVGQIANDAQPTGEGRWSGLRAWWALYTGNTSHSYWHRGIEARVRRIAASPGVEETVA